MKSIIEQKFDEILGRPCWNVRKMFASNISFDFGLPHLNIYEPEAGDAKPSRVIIIEGEWRIWINCCHWRIFDENVLLAHDNSSDESILKALNDVNGAALQRVLVQPKSGKSEFHFEFGKVVKTLPYAELDPDGDPYTSWSVFFPGNLAMSYRADGKYKYGDTDSGDDLWL